MNMRPHNYHRIVFLCSCLLFFGAWGCGERADAPPPAPKVVPQKITISEAPTAAAPAAQEKTPQQSTTAEQAVSTQTPVEPSKASPVAPPAVEAPAAPVATDTPAPPTTGKTVPSLPAGIGYSADDVTQQVKIDVKGTMADLTEKVATEGNSLYRSRFYNPEGKIDPFAPIFKQSSQETIATATTKVKREKRVPQTPLERLSLGQLTLVGIIRMQSGNRAIVQEASGKGYVVKNGTYIGPNAGRVIDIEENRVVIEEEVENVLGDVITRKQELKLQKPLGEE
ncbi:MAG: pilus assembly protein PilP [Pseudomonadota bacterium]